MTKSTRQKRPPTHLRVILVGCGAVGRWLLRPLLVYLQHHVDGTFKVSVIDGQGEKVRRVVADALTEFPSAVVNEAHEYLVRGNIAGHIKDGDFVFVCVDNTATIKLVSDHAVTLWDVTAMNGWCWWCDGAVQLHVRRQGRNLTPQFADRYHPEYLDPKFPNPGDAPASDRIPIKSEPVCIANSNLTAALMVALFHRVLKGGFGKSMPEIGEYYLDANQGRVVGRKRE